MLQGNAGIEAQAKKLRAAMSLPEVLLWQSLRTNKEGLRFRRQHPSGPFVADFYCHKAKPVIEIDGMMHDCGDRPARDVSRDQWFAQRGIAVIRIPASDVLSDVQTVAEALVADAVHRISTAQSFAS